ncbi:putative ABC transport system permease protein [Dyadobacter sp. BE34]|uniref:ABC transport system permease protein n=1 Tax=Dyadobacter fermentans TaxID=94254 RepID=A0ABU1QRR9_9BACT|nr:MULTISPECIES: ABC transporter permease [Dyadobacter]MDR6803863.1 putative ABC transport system permease protein [Dyadobacter fermentans]MDR7041603.1 putative ABC transport system permease protein [Dyadobacter sp. BE242]MDR7196006.1 putative ABC transport system permease protein [Dyadobacter sp. BE34]MDR7213449.1 putative ABC transport system permease protein [Dyadobacter sp. BE31]MDR7261412.1 putative ABC transport system permease protein [Dyadobacter sp. BE32]
MLKNYLKIALRNIWKNKVFSAINIVGLAVGMAACIVIMLFVFYERSFDRMHSGDIYRLNEVQTFDGMTPQNVALSMYPMGPTLKQEFSEVKSFVRINGTGKIPVFYKGKRVELAQSFLTDPDFFTMFDFPLEQGDRNHALIDPNSVVLTRKAASNLFGTEAPMGRTIHVYGNDTLTLKVTGIMADVPGTSHLQFDALVSFNTIAKPDFMENWGSNWLNTYLRLADQTDVAALEKKFPAYLKRHMKDEHWKHFELFLQPLTDIHAGSTDITHDYVNFQKFDIRYTYVFSIIAAIVLVIACVNFMNLSTARSAARAKEVGIRKSIGARRAELARQFIGESVLLALLALVLALGMVWLLMPAVANFSQRPLNFSFLETPGLLPLLLAGTVLIGVISGIYPAFFLSAFEPVKVLKGVVRSGKSRFRNALVVAQFSSAVFLIVATAFAARQLNYMINKDPGFDKEQVVIIPLDSRSDTKYDALKGEMLRSAFINGVTGSQQRLGNNLHQTAIHFQGTGPKRELTSSQIIVDPDFLSLYKIKLIAGRDFTDSPADNAKTYIINKALAQELLKNEPDLTLESLVGKQFGFYGMDSLSRIVGVVEDFNFNSLHHKIEPLCIFNQKDWNYSEISVRVKGKDAQQAVAAMQAAWSKILPEEPFTYSFLDEHFDEMYRADSQVSEIVGILAGLAIFISCLGLFGLASYSAERRIKEIGVRKVMGASVAGIVALLSRDFLKLVLVAILIATPVAWWAVRTWLNDFAYRIDIEWWMFLLAGALAVLVALFTISFQSIKAALTNPVKSLRAE